MPCSSHPPPTSYPPDHRVPPIRRQILDWESSLFFSLIAPFSNLGNRPYFTHMRLGTRRLLSENYRVSTTSEGVLGVLGGLVVGGFNVFADVVIAPVVWGWELLQR